MRHCGSDDDDGNSIGSRNRNHNAKHPRESTRAQFHTPIRLILWIKRVTLLFSFFTQLTWQNAITKHFAYRCICTDHVHVAFRIQCRIINTQLSICPMISSNLINQIIEMPIYSIINIKLIIIYYIAPHVCIRSNTKLMYPTRTCSIHARIPRIYVCWCDEESWRCFRQKNCLLSGIINGLIEREACDTFIDRNIYGMLYSMYIYNIM